MRRCAAVLAGLILGGVLPAASGCGRTQPSLLLLDALPTVGAVEIEGNAAFDDGTLRRLMTLRGGSIVRPLGGQKFSPRQLDADVLAILTFYMRHGYLRARVTDRQIRERGGRVDITLFVEEGRPVTTRETDIRFPDGEDSSFEDLFGGSVAEVRGRLRTAAGRPFDPFALDEDRRILHRLLAERGRPLAAVAPSAQFAGDEAIVFYLIRPDTLFRVGKVAFAGNDRLSDAVLHRELEIRPGDPYRESRILATQEMLLHTGHFTDVRWDTTGVDREAGRVDIRFTVRERRQSWLEAGFGVSSENRLRLTGTWGTRNLLGSGARLALIDRTDIDLGRGVGSWVDEHRSEILYLRRHVLGTAWEGQPGLFYIHDRELSYRQDIVGLSANTRRRLGDVRDQLVFSFENRWVMNDADSTARANDVQLEKDRYQTRILSGIVQLDSRNDFFDPTRGGSGELRLDVAGGALGGNTGFRKATGSVRAFRSVLPGRLTVACRLQAGGIDPAASTGGTPTVATAELVPAEDRYRLGGASTVRGYEEDVLDGAITAEDVVGGVLTLLGNLELRARVVSRFSLVGFLDAGNVWQDPGQLGWTRLVPRRSGAEVDPRDVRYTYGAGLRFATPVGPVRLDYARKWNNPRDDERSPGEGRWHVSLGHAF